MSAPDRLHALDAVRAFALLLGIAFHATMSFLPGFGASGWPIIDVSSSATLSGVFYVSHMFRMTTFFFIAGFFAHLVFHRRGTGTFFKDRSKRILVPLVVGWLLLFPAIALTLYWGAVKSGAPATPPPVPDDAVLPFPLTHLWFLYLLFGFYLLFVPARALAIRAIDRSGRLRTLVDGGVARALHTGIAPLVLAAPVAWALSSSPSWLLWAGIPTPDLSLIPNIAAFTGYGVAFAFGWVLHRQVPHLHALTRHWAPYLAAAAALTLYCLSVVGISPPLVQEAGSTGSHRSLYALCYAMAGWCWTLGLTGGALRLLARENRTVRYLADASYWMYLLHLPLVFALQVVVMDWQAHWSLKYPLILAGAIAVLLASYDLLVRPTYLGEMLNGRRHPRMLRLRGSAFAAPEDLPDPAHAPAGELASLSAVHKRYGSTAALDGVDLDVRPGELLALLGPNGAGKSTAIALLLGLKEPDAGTARLFGRSPHELEARRRIGVMMQEVAMVPELTVRELIDQASNYYPAPLPMARTLALTHLELLADRTYNKLSGGEKRQVQFAIAVCGAPQLIFLDEPTVGLDVQARQRMWQTIRALIIQGRSVVLTTHYIEEAEALADRVVVLNKGRVIAAGTVAEVRSVVERRRISCTTALGVDDISRWPEVQSVERSGLQTLITTTHGELLTRRLLAADESLTELEIRRAGLSEAFDELIHEEQT